MMPVFTLFIDSINIRSIHDFYPQLVALANALQKHDTRTVVEPGEFEIMFGASAEDLKLVKVFMLN